MSSRRSSILLDTHVWVWLVNGDDQLGERAREGIEGAAHAGLLLVSAISVWEIGLLESKGRIRLGKEPLEWVNEALTQPGVGLAPLLPEIAIASSRLPGSFHGDPADRILVATARALGATLLTRDARIREYARGDHVQVLAV